MIERIKGMIMAGYEWFNIFAEECTMWKSFGKNTG
jgi:hypothetical protein